jgi:septum site-determining protein MinD
MANRNTIGIISIKGGVGKTSCAVNLAAALSYEFEKKVLALDANYSAPNLGIHLGITNPGITLNEVIRKNLHISHAVNKYTENLHVVPCSIIGRKVNPFELREKIRAVKDDYDSIVIDSSPSLNHEMISTIAAADRLFVVTTPDYPTLSCTLHAIKAATRKRTRISGIILNKVRNKRFELSLEDIEHACNVPVVAIIPEDVAMLESLAMTKPVVLHKPKSGASISYKKLAAAIADMDYDDPRFMMKLKNIFRSSVGKDELNRIGLRNER